MKPARPQFIPRVVSEEPKQPWFVATKKVAGDLVMTSKGVIRHG